MRDLNGFFKKILLIFSIFLFPLLFTNTVQASDFNVYSDFHHVWDGNNINSTIYLSINSEKNSTLLTSFTITIPDEKISPKVFSVNRNEALEPTFHRRSGATDIVLDLNNTPISPKNPVTLKLTYSVKNSDNEFSLLSAINETSNRKFTFTYPTEKGDITWSSVPILQTIKKGSNTQIITDNPKSNSVRFLIGNPVSYKFLINRNLANPSEEMILSDILLPLNNSKQHILLQGIEPVPDKSYKDTEGNYILQYSIAPESNIEVNISGYILMNKSSYPYENTYLIESNPVWKISDISLIRNINRYIKASGVDISETFKDINDIEKESEKEIIYKAIYGYVIEKLKPNTLTLGSLTGSERFTAQEILLKQDESTSEGYADALIGIYRYYNIPARLIIGYITDISNYHPDGMYHYWVEYLDRSKNDWITVDPFLDDYSKTSLWNSNFNDHISLIYRYNNPNTPKLTYFSENDFMIERQDNIPELIHDFKLNLMFEPYSITNPYLNGSIGVVNTGNTVLDLFTISNSNPNLNKYIDYIENNSQNILLPSQSLKIKFNIPAQEIEDNIFAVIDALSGTEEIKNRYVEDTLEIVEDDKNLDILTRLLSLIIFLTFLTAIYFISKKVKIKNG